MSHSIFRLQAAVAPGINHVFKLIVALLLLTVAGLVAAKPSAPPTVTMTKPSITDTFVAPADIQISADVRSSDGIVKVALFNGKKMLAKDMAAPYYYLWKNVPVGTYELTFEAKGENGKAVTSEVRTVVVKENLPPVVQIRSPLTNSSFHVPPRLVAAATDVDGRIASVEFFDGETSVARVFGPTYESHWPGATVGTHTLTARATDDKGAVTISSPVVVTILHNQPPAIRIASPSPGAVYGVPATVDIVAEASDVDGFVQSVKFFHNSLFVAEVVKAPWVYRASRLWTGEHEFYVVAVDNLGGSRATNVKFSVWKNESPSISLSSTSSGLVEPATIALAATPFDRDGGIARVDFYSGAALIGSAMEAPYTFTWPDQGAGTYTLSARATDSSGDVATSNTVTVTVAQNVPPVVSVTSSNGLAPNQFIFTATAADSDGIAKVEFFKGETLLGATTAAPYVFTWDDVPPGSHTITATATDRYGRAASAAVTVEVAGIAGSVYYIQTDQIGTPQLISDQAGQAVWVAQDDPFGAKLPIENPTGQGLFVYNPRFPGQYFDRETGLHYNYYRDYDPQTGRYVQSDPIGLDGGINTYGYVENDPLSYVDPEGLSRGGVRRGGGSDVWPGRAGPSRQGTYYRGQFYESFVGAQFRPVRIESSNGPMQCGVCMDVYYIAPQIGPGRGSHRPHGNIHFSQYLNSSGAPPTVAGISARDILRHMNSGRGRDLINPPGFEWHHPVGNPNVIWLIRRCDHQNPANQDYLHPNGIGGIGIYGNGRK